MKTEEDEAFDELARKQGSWGGGFQAKRAAAADKLREPEREALKLLEDATRSCNNIDEQRALDALMRGVQPAQDGKCKYCVNGCAACDARAQPAQEPVARVSGTYGGRFTYEPINRAMVLPIGMALYAAPPTQELVAREWNFCERCGKRTADLTVIHTCTPPQEKNND